MKTAIFSLVIAISVALLSVFQFNRYQTFTLNTQMNLKKIEDTVNLKLDGSHKDIETLKEQEYAILTRMQDPLWKDIQTNLKKIESEVNTKIEAFNQDLNTLKEQENTILTHIQNPAWKMDEIKYLFYLAAARLQGITNIKVAIDLLSTAQTKIKDLNNPKLTPLFQALTNDIETLRTISPPNTEEIWLKISALIEQTPKLSFRDVTVNEDKKENDAHLNTVEKAGSWKQAFLKIFKEIKSFIKIRHYSKPVEPLLSETQQTMIATNLRLLLEQMRFAVLTEDQIIYQHAMRNTEQLLTAYYNNADPTVQDFLNTLTELAKINLRPALPKMTSLELLNTL